jgi:hypothetical protein
VFCYSNGKLISTVGFCELFLDMTPEAVSVKEKIDKLELFFFQRALVRG